MNGCDRRGGQDFALSITGDWKEAEYVYGAPESVWVLKRSSEQVRRSVFYFADYVAHVVPSGTSYWTWSDVMLKEGVPSQFKFGEGMVLDG